MKRPITNLVLGWMALLLAVFQLNAQSTTFTVTPQTVTGNPGDQFTVNIEVTDFNNILSMQYSMGWDASAIDFVPPVGNLTNALPGFTAANFGTNNAGNGILTLSWLDPNVQGVTLPNGTVLYSLTFQILTATGTDIAFTNSPTIIELIDGNGNAVNFVGQDAAVNGGGNGGGGGGGNPGDLIVIASDEVAASGSSTCVDVSVQNFDNILSMQYSMHFEPTIVQFTGVQGLNLPGLVASNIGTNNAANGDLTFSWLDPNVSGVTVPDNTVIYQICFDVVGTNGQVSPFSFDGTPTTIEVIDGNSNPVNMTPNNGSVTVSGGTPPPPPPAVGFAILASDTTVESGQNFCMRFSVQDFTDIVSMQYTMTYDQNKLDFTGFQNLNLTGLATSNFNTNTPGVITVSWLDPAVAGITLNNGEVIYEICFDAIGANNCNNSTQLSFTGDPTPIEVIDKDGNEVDFNSSPGVVSICDGGGGGGGTPTNLTFTASNETGENGTELCVDVSVDLFDCIVSAQYSMHFDPTVLEYTTVNNFGLPDMTLGGNFGSVNANTGVITFSWIDPSTTGVTVPNGTVIYSVCFNVIGSSGDTSPFSFDGDPTIVEVTDCNSGVLNPDFVAGTETVGNPCPGPVSIVGGVVNDILCFGAATGSVDISVTGGDNNYTYVWTNAGGQQVSTNQDLTAATVGTYTVVVSSCSGGTTATASYTIGQPASGMTLTGNIIHIKCFGDNTGTVDLMVSGGFVNPPSCNYTFKWSDPSGSTFENLFGVGAGTYTVTVTDCNNCQATETFTINGPASSLALSAIPAPTLCFGECSGQINASATGGVPPYQFMINNDPWQNVGTFNDLCAGSYTVKTRDAIGCIRSTTITVTAPSEVQLSAAVTNTTAGCNGSINLSPTGGTPPYAFNWTGPNVNFTTEDIGNLCPGEYCVTVTDFKGCTKTLCETVQAPLSISLDAIPSCFGQCTGELNVNTTGGEPPFTFAWSGGPSNPSGQNPKDLCPGTYTVTVTSADGQVQTATETVDGATSAVQILDADVSLLSLPTSNDGIITLTVTGGFGNYTYNWSNGATTNPATGLSAGSYSVTVTDLYGCTVVGGPYTVFFSTSPMSLDVNGSAVCVADISDGGTLSVSVTGGLAPYDFQFSGPDVIDPVQNDQDGQLTISGLTPGNYCVTVTDAAPGTFNQELDDCDEIRVIDLEITPISITPVTNGNNGQIDITVTGGDQVYTFVWDDGSTSQDLNNIQPGSYDVVITDANGCIEEFTGILVEEFTATSNAVMNDCPSDENGSITVIPNGSLNAPFTYSWSNSETTQTISGLSVGTYTVTITDTLNASIVASFDVTSLSNLGANIQGTTDILCYGDATGGAKVEPFDGMSPYTYAWNNSVFLNEIFNVPAGDYSVTVTDAVNCKVEAALTISQPDILKVTITTDNGADCAEGNGRATANVTGGISPYSYSWDDPLDQNGKTAILLDPGAFTVTVADDNGCEETADAIIDEITPLIVEGLSVPDSGGPDGEAIANVVSGTPPYTFEWRDYLVTDSILTELLPDLYFVKVSDANGCEELVTIRVEDATICLEASAIITPEGDGFNEEFKLGCLSRYSDNRLEIFNRWGQSVFLADDYNNDKLWRGTNRRGNDVPDGVYYYVFEYFDPVSGTQQTQKGAVTVLRK